MRTLSLEVVTPLGTALAVPAVDSVVVRRSEARFERGGRIEFLPGHAPEIVRTGECELDYRLPGGERRAVRIGAGFAEVRRGRVTVAVPWVREAPRTRGRRGA